MEFSVISSEHDASKFDCNDKALNEWLLKKALKNTQQGFSKVYVVLDENQIIAFYAIASGAIDRHEVPGNLSRNAPNPLPIIVLGRLAVDKKFQQQGIGAGLLKNCVVRTQSIASQLGVKALLVHAIDEAAAEFYRHFGFVESKFDNQILLLPVQSQ